MTKPALAPNLDQLAREILHYEDMAIQYSEDSIKFRVEIGRRLIRVKDVLPHGRFLPWVKQYIPYHRTYASQHMKLARNVERVKHLPPDTSVRMVLHALSKPRSNESRTTEHPRLVVALDSGGEALLEIKNGDFGALCDTFRSRKLPFRLELRPARKKAAA